MRVTRLAKHNCGRFIKRAIGMSVLVCLLGILHQYSTRPPTFWSIQPKDNVIPLPYKVSMDVKMTVLKNYLLMVAVCARNVEQNLPLFRKNIENITSLFGQYRIFIGESDSSDRTLTYLHQWSQVNNRVIVKTYGNLSHIHLLRSDRIAYCRNDLLNEIQQTHLFQKSQNAFYMVADADINAQLNQLNFLSNFDYVFTEWGAMTANQHSGYYDIWALRNDVVNYDCWHVADNIFIQLFTLNQAVEFYVGVHQKTIPSNHSLISVKSAFGGAAIYQKKYINGCKYSGYDSHKICEHVSFNLCVTRNGGRIFINPKFLIG